MSSNSKGIDYKSEADLSRRAHRSTGSNNQQEVLELFERDFTKRRMSPSY